MRNNRSYYFGPRLHKPYIKKEPTKLMKKSLKQLKKTRECFMSMSNNNDNEQGGADDVSKRDIKHKFVPQRTQQTPLEESSQVTVAPRRNDMKCSMRLNNMTSSLENIEKSRPSLSRILEKNTDMSRSSCSKPENGVVSFQRITKSSSSSNNAIVCLQNDIKKSIPPSSRPNYVMDSLQKITNGAAFPLKNIEKPRSSYLSLTHGEASLSKNAEMPRYSSLRPNNDTVSRQANIKNNESRKSGPSRLRNGFSSVLQDDSDSMDGISNKPHPTSMSGNSGIAVQIVDSEAKKEILPMAMETHNNSLTGKGNQARQANMGIHHVSLLSKNLPSRQIAEVSCMVSNMEHHDESMNKDIKHDSAYQKTSLLEDGVTNGEKFKSTKMEPLLENKLETHGKVEICRSKKKSGRFIVHGDDESVYGAHDLACAKKGIARFTKSMDIEPKNKKTSREEDVRIIDDKVRKRSNPPLGEKLETREDDDSEEAENCRPTKRRRRLILSECEDDDDGDQNMSGSEIGTSGLTTQTAGFKGCPMEVSNPFISESLKLQYYGSLPIAEPVWR
jgi:hypothetical protein